MEVKVRKATLNDVKEIVEVHCSDVEKWYKWVGEHKVESNYEELSVEERWGHGGPWMSMETCSVHLNYILTHNQYPLVAEVNSKVVGELELYIGEERSVLGKTAFIDILVVHKDFRRKGIGRTLIRKAIEIAKSENCKTVSVWPAKNAIRFYEKCGFKKLFSINKVIIDIEELSGIGKRNEAKCVKKSFPQNYDVLKNMILVSPRIESSYTIWLKNKWAYAVEEAKAICDEGYIENLNVAYIIENIWRSREEAKLTLWISNRENILRALKFIASSSLNMGFKKLTMFVENNLYESYVEKQVPCMIKDKEFLMAVNI
ncbi:MAG: GNAT family N-acetyltransferase [Thermoprotei archaeon]|nr:MAG: GNAT family N-acetyltransferase [Thermoprotei archaeon]